MTALRTCMSRAMAGTTACRVRSWSIGSRLRFGRVISTAGPAAFTTSSASSVEVDGRTYRTDSWFNVPANVLAAASRRLYLQKDHPVAITRQIIEARFPAPEFRAYSGLHPVVSTFQNFDSLGFPADHPGRARSDTYYVNGETLLRTHTSAHELETFRASASPGFLLSADVYRRDEVDRTHYPVFHQMEGARVWDRASVDGGDLAATIRGDLARLPQHDVAVEDASPPEHPERNPRQTDAHSAAEVAALGAHLKRSLELMVVDVFTRAAHATTAPTEPLQMRWVEAYFPFTSPSWELEVLWQGSWLEVLGCGVSRQSILRAAGVPSQIGWAFGIGLDRIAMLLFQIPDIRLFWSADPRFLGQFHGVSDNLDRLRRFVPFSRYPACYKDVSFWEPAAAALHNNDVMELIRSVAGDVVEDVRLTDRFAHPRTGRQSRCYRINYRSLERTLTNAETNRLHADVRDALVQRLGVQIR
ncbi:phenylalanyl-tRNA synthetase alpha subunit [Grosmannia clavigera kw1407]|uniref:Phenylalanine--tRNA ligase, mitochondrial n=1 Tax=Grosmannia clavigera (strain kw1407 / UAMH 11150) TaxID=655863 RepID=F0XTZ0_GROCL|nr:phenylalanyl-tRNA synthetase alpha subunit [Grosmannia clavigera kw1407]EFW98752.1 phenylalanyl-tRNA synthetase alpha subunit [Grosmannia clavigera kw1407]